MLETRISKLEDTAHDTRERLARIETSLDGISTHGATKADLEKGLNTQTWKMIGACTLLVGAVFWLDTHLAKDAATATPPLSPQVTPSRSTAPAEIPARPQ